MVSTKIRRLQRMYDNSLDENLSLSADLLAEMEKKKRFIKIACILDQLCFFGAGLTILVIIVLCCLEDGEHIFSPLIHAINQDEAFRGRTMLSIAAVPLLSFPVNLILSIVERFIPVKAENSKGGSQAEKLKSLKDNLCTMHKIEESGYLPAYAVAGVQCTVFAIVFGLTLLAVSILEARLMGETMYNSIIGIIEGVISAGFVSSIFWCICIGYFGIRNFFIRIIYLHIPFGGSHVGRLLSIYADYEECIRVDAMSPSERSQYFQQKKETEERAEREYREKQGRRAIYNSYSSGTSSSLGSTSSGSWFDGTSPTLTGRDHDDLDMALNMMDQNFSDGM